MYSQTEKDIHKAVVDYCRLRGLLFLHVPNEGKRTVNEGRLQAALGLSPGAPDLLIFNRTERWTGLALELKTAKGVVSVVQGIWLNNLALEGWRVSVPRSVQDAVAVIDDVYPVPVTAKPPGQRR